MATFGKQFLSASTNGRPIKVVATATAGTLIHTAVTGTADIDEVWLYCTNTDTVTRKLTIEFGGATDPDDLIEIGIPAEAGLVLVCPGLLLQNSLAIRAFGDAANVLCISGYANRITA
jgi:hypothetical protein